jgi:hypothetical protein
LSGWKLLDPTTYISKASQGTTGLLSVFTKHDLEDKVETEFGVHNPSKTK